MSDKFSMIIPLFKVDIARHEVWGIGADETPDQSGEIFDYAESKPYIMAWSEKMQKASGGKSKGNIRGQHGSVAAGRVIDLKLDDKMKRVIIGAEIVDTAEWEKVEKGVYTGFSIGGHYAKRWNDDAGRKRYAGAPAEWSLVDYPNNPNATFELVKADGVTELRKFDLKKENPMEPTEETPAEEAQEEKDEHAGLKATLSAMVTAKKLDAAVAASIWDSIMADEAKELGKAGMPWQTDKPKEKGDAPPAKEEIPVQAADEAESPEEAAAETPADEAAEAAQTGEAPAGDAGENPEAEAPKPVTVETVQAIVLDILVTLGLVEKKDAETGKTMYQAVKTDGLEKSALNTAMQLRDETDAEIRRDLVKVISAIQNLEKRGFSGPVVRELGSGGDSAGKSQQLAVMNDMLAKAIDPGVRQALQAEITQLEIKQVRQRGQ